MFKKTQTKRSSVRAPRDSGTLNQSFRRNNVVISRTQREVAQKHQTVTQRQEDLKRHKAHQQLKNRVIAAIILVAIAGLGLRMRVNAISVNSNASTKLGSTERLAYEATISSEYHKHTLAGQSWLLDESGLRQAILRQYPEIEAVNFDSNTPFSTKMNAELRFRTAVFTWLDASKTRQFVDKNGVLFSKNLNPSVDEKKLISIEDQSGVVLDPGTSVLTTSLIQFIGQLHAKLPQLYGKEVHVSRVIIPKSTREVQIQVSSQQYLIKLNSTRDLGQQIGELGALLTYLKSNNITPSAYIDLRVAHRAFYK